MSALHPLDWEILNATADDAENLEQIYLAVCFEFLADAGDGAGVLRRLPHSASLGEVADRLCGLVDRGLLAPLSENEGRPELEPCCDDSAWKAWFAMTDEGRRLWAADPVAFPDEPNARPAAKIHDLPLRFHPQEGDVHDA